MLKLFTLQVGRFWLCDMKPFTSMKRLLLFGAATAWLVSASPAKADLFVSADCDIADPLIGLYNQVPGIDTGNQQFFANILGSGSSVAVLHTGSAQYDPSGQIVTDVNQFYNGLDGKTSTVISGTISSLAGYNLLVVPLPDHAFTSGEITVLRDFLAAGNSVFFLGENDSFTLENPNINNDLTALGSTIQIVPASFDAGWHTATGSQIALDPFTTGVSHFSYAAPSMVSGGNYLVFGTGAQPFVTYSAVVPEPSTVSLACLGVLALVWRLRRTGRL
jgi:hypothetical protein